MKEIVRNILFVTAAFFLMFSTALVEAQMNPSLEGKKVAILATDGFEKSELLEPRNALEAAGAETAIVSLKKGEIKSWTAGNWGPTVKVDMVIAEVKPSDFDALMLPGGVINPDKLRIDDEAIEFIKAFVDAQKPIAAICHGPWPLIDAGGVKGKKVTSWPSLKHDLLNAGATWVDEEVVVDGMLVTSRKPDDIPAFTEAFTSLLAK